MGKRKKKYLPIYSERDIKLLSVNFYLASQFRQNLTLSMNTSVLIYFNTVFTTFQLLQSQHPSPAVGLPHLQLTTCGISWALLGGPLHAFGPKYPLSLLLLAHILSAVDPRSSPDPHQLHRSSSDSQRHCTDPLAGLRLKHFVFATTLKNKLWAVFNNQLCNVMHFQPPPAYAEHWEMLICREGRRPKDRLPRKGCKLCATPENTSAQQGGLNTAPVITLSPKWFCNSMRIS